MKTQKTLKQLLGSFLVMIFLTQISIAQTYQLNNGSSTLRVDGTSNLHDWDLKAENQKGKISVEMADGKVTAIKDLQLSVVAESLKSGKSGMDKNTYKALKTSQHKEITFKLTKVNSINCTGSTCKVSLNGNLNIAGTSKPVDMTFDMTSTSSNITLTGNKKMKMTTFNVEPPTAMFGTITTGDEIDVVFKSVFTK